MFSKDFACFYAGVWLNQIGYFGWLFLFASGKDDTNMKNIDRAKEWQRKLYEALNWGWKEEDFTADWIYKPYGADWDALYEQGLAPVKFCALCGEDNLGEKPGSISNQHSSHNVPVFLCEECSRAKGYPPAGGGGCLAMILTALVGFGMVAFVICFLL